MDTKEKQMKIDDYLNRDQVAIMNTAESVEVAEENKLDIEPIDYNNLSKTQLIGIMYDKDKAIKNYEDKINKEYEAHKIEIENLNKYYTDRTKELHSIISYYERKLKVLGDIILMETGGEK